MDCHFEINLVAELLRAIFSAANPFILCWNFRVFIERESVSWMLSNDRRPRSTSARALWKEGESGATSVFHAFLGANYWRQKRWPSVPLRLTCWCDVISDLSGRGVCKVERAWLMIVSWSSHDAILSLRSSWVINFILKNNLYILYSNWKHDVINTQVIQVIVSQVKSSPESLTSKSESSLKS